MAVNLAYADVKCADCGAEYVCTPNQDYFHPVGFTEAKTATNGYCWNCFMKFHGLKQQPEPPYV